MRHRVKGRKFGRKRGQRKAFLKILASNLIMNERIVTTEARAKEIKSKVEKLITLAKRRGGDLSSFRHLLKHLSKKAATKVRDDLRVRYQSRYGGYLRIIKTPNYRIRDGARNVILEFVK
jgi:large subunit ribosomal protein L17